MTSKASACTDTLAAGYATAGAFNAADLVAAIALGHIDTADATALITAGYSTNTLKADLVAALALADVSGVPIGAVLYGMSRQSIAAGILHDGTATVVSRSKTTGATGWGKTLNAWARGDGPTATSANLASARAWLAGI